ncbi:MAG: hypothetical protein ACLFQ6_10610, partial [Candidatus Sumerlaeia bacterium]
MPKERIENYPTTRIHRALERFFPDEGLPAWFTAALGIFLSLLYYNIERIAMAQGRLDWPVYADKWRAHFNAPALAFALFSLWGLLGGLYSRRIYRRAARSDKPEKMQDEAMQFLASWAKKDLVCTAIWLFYPLAWVLPQMIDFSSLLPAFLLEKMQREGFDPANRTMVSMMGLFYLALLFSKTWFFYEYLQRTGRYWQTTAAKGLGLLALLFFAFAALWTMAEYPPTGDEPHYLITAHSLVHDGDLKLANNFARQDYRLFRDHLESQFDTDSDQFVARHEIFFPVLIAIPYALGGRFLVVLFLVLFAAFAVWQLAMVMLELCENQRSAFRACGVAAFLSPFFIFSAQVYPESVAALIVILGMRLIVSERTNRLHGLLLLGLCVLALPMLKARFALLSVSLCVFAFFHPKKRSRLMLALPPMLVLLMVALFVVDVLFIGGYAYYGRFKVALRVIQGNYAFMEYVRFMMAGIYDQGSSPVPYMPVLLMGFTGLAVGLRRDWKRALLFFQLIMVYYFVKSPYWETGWSPAGRYVVCLMPAVAWFIAQAFALRNIWIQRLWKVLVWISAGIVFVLTLLPAFRYPLLDGISSFWRLVGKATHAPFTRFWPAFTTRPDSAWNLIFSLGCTAIFLALGFIVT